MEAYLSVCAASRLSCPSRTWPRNRSSCRRARARRTRCRDRNGRRCSSSPALGIRLQPEAQHLVGAHQLHPEKAVIDLFVVGMDEVHEGLQVGRRPPLVEIGLAKARGPPRGSGGRRCRCCGCEAPPPGPAWSLRSGTRGHRAAPCRGAHVPCGWPDRTPPENSAAARFHLGSLFLVSFSSLFHVIWPETAGRYKRKLKRMPPQNPRFS
jgi:hypothetical protein